MSASLTVPRQKLSRPEIRNRVFIPTKYGRCEFVSFFNLSDQLEHIAIIFKKADRQICPRVRIHSACLTGDLFSSKKCDCGAQLNEALYSFSEEGGIILYLQQEGRGIGLYNKLDAYQLQAKGYDTFQANQALNFVDDLRSYKVAADILQALNIDNIDLLTNNPDKVNQLINAKIKVNKTFKTEVYVCPENYNYLKSKKEKAHHNLALKKSNDYHNASLIFKDDI